MAAVALAFAIAAAFLHAFWNLLLARARDPEAAAAVMLLFGLVAFAPRPPHPSQPSGRQAS